MYAIRSYYDLVGRQVFVHVLPGLVGVGNQFLGSIRAGNVLGQGQVQILTGDVELFGILAVGNNDTIITDLVITSYSIHYTKLYELDRRLPLRRTLSRHGRGAGIRPHPLLSLL